MNLSIEWSHRAAVSCGNTSPTSALPPHAPIQPWGDGVTQSGVADEVEQR